MTNSACPNCGSAIQRTNRICESCNPAVDDAPAALIDWLDKLLKFRSFIATRNAVKSGVRLFEMPARQTAASGFLGPWAFNAYESALASLPAQALVLVLVFLNAMVASNTSASQPVTDPALTGIGDILQAITSFLASLIAPSILTLTALVAGRASLRPEDATPARRRIATHAYLYFEGSHGLPSEAALGLATTTLLSLRHYERFLPLWFVTPVVIIGAIALFRVRRDRRETIPKMLFILNGYEGVASDSNQSSETETLVANRGPWERYLKWVGLSPYLILPGVFAVYMALVYVAAFVLIAFQRLIA